MRDDKLGRVTDGLTGQDIRLRGECQRLTAQRRWRIEGDDDCRLGNTNRLLGTTIKDIGRQRSGTGIKYKLEKPEVFAELKQRAPMRRLMRVGIGRW